MDKKLVVFFFPKKRVTVLVCHVYGYILCSFLDFIRDSLCFFLDFITGVRSVEVDLANQVVRVLGSSTVKTMTDALEQAGRKARLIGQGVPDG